MYLALKLKSVEGSGYKTYNTKKKRQRRDKSWWNNDGGTTGGSNFYRYSCKQHFALIFFHYWSVHQTSANLQLYWTVNAQVFAFQQLQDGYLRKQGSFALRRVRLWSRSWRNYGNAFVWTFCTRRIKWLVDPTASCCMVNWGWLFLHFQFAISKYEN